MDQARRQNARRKREVRRDVALIVMLVAMGFVYLSLAGFGGNVGRALGMILFGVFGIGAWCVPVWIFVFIMYLLTQRGGRQMPVRLLSAFVLILILQSAGHLYLHMTGRISLDVPFSAVETFHLCSENSFGGGLTGGWFARLLYRAFGVIGSVLVCFGISVASVILLLQRSPLGIYRAWLEQREKEGIPGFSERQAIRRRLRQEALEAEEEARLERDAERILQREDKAAARRAKREEDSVRTGRKRRGSAGAKQLDLEQMVVSSGKPASKPSIRAYAEKPSIRAYTESESGIDRKRGSGRIENGDRRKDIHEIIVLPSDEGGLMTAASASYVPEPVVNSTLNSSSDPHSDNFPDGMTDGMLDRTDRDNAGFSAAGLPGESREDTAPEDLRSKFSAGTDTAPAGPVGNDTAGIYPSEPFEGYEGSSPGAGMPAGAATDTAAAAGTDTAGTDTAGKDRAVSDGGFSVPTKEELEGISVHRDTGNAAGPAGAGRTAVPRRQNSYVPPTFSLLEKAGSDHSEETDLELKQTAHRLQETLRTFGVQVTITDISRGPSVTRYELNPDKGVKVSRIVNLSDDIKLRLAATDIRIEAPIPGKSAIGIEVPNKIETTVHLRELLESREFRRFEGKLPFAVGKDIAGKNVIADIARMPHLLIAGATGSGKSVCINTIILSILYRTSPEKVRLLMIDPKVVELSVYKKIPHLIIPVVTDARKASAALNWAVAEMEKRYKLFAAAGVRDLNGYNALASSYRNEDGELERDPLPRLVIIVDELADLMMVAKSEVESAICRLAQLARAAGIHLIIATQRPSVDVITGLIKANMPSRIAFAVSSQVDSRTILDMAGAEKLIGRGDMLFYPQNYQKPARIQGAFVSDDEVTNVVDYIKKHNAADNQDKEIDRQIEDIAENGGSMPTAGEVKTTPGRDEYFAEAGRFIIEKNKASIGLLQRVFKIGFNRAARIMDQLAEAGVVSEESSTRARQVLMSMPEFEAYLENES